MLHLRHVTGSTEAAPYVIRSKKVQVSSWKIALFIDSRLPNGRCGPGLACDLHYSTVGRREKNCLLSFFLPSSFHLLSTK